MLMLIAAALAGSASGTADARVSNLPGLFQATCLDGQATLRSGEVTPISVDQLPAQLRESLGHPSSGKVWQLNDAGHSYLYVLDYSAAPGVSPKICGLASDAMDMRTASDAVEVRVTGGVSRNKSRSAQWLNAKDGYVATVTPVATFNVLQISWMSDADHSAAIAQVEQLPH